MANNFNYSNERC